MIDRDVLFQVEQLNKAYTRTLDDDRLEEWPECFVDDSRYVIQSRENLQAGLYGYVLYFESKSMLRDRVTSLRKANYYNIHFDRHIVSNVDIVGQEDGCWHARANFCVIQTDVEGRSEIFCTGEYRDKVVLAEGTMKFKERLVVTDTGNIKGLLAVPL